MAMIKYPECGEEEKKERASAPAINGKLKKVLKKNIIPIAAVILAVAIGVLIYNVKVVRPEKKYNEAHQLLEEGKYEEASNLLRKIEGYKDVDTIQEQIKYETYAYSAINNLKKYLKSPNSYQPYEIKFYASMGGGEASSSESAASEEQLPVCIMYYGAKNAFGGTTTSYALFTYNSDTKGYKVMGACHSLDENEYDPDDAEDGKDLSICKLINQYRAGDDTIGSIDLDRLKTVLNNDAYSAIKIME